MRSLAYMQNFCPSLFESRAGPPQAWLLSAVEVGLGEKVTSPPVDQKYCGRAGEQAVANPTPAVW